MGPAGKSGHPGGMRTGLLSHFSVPPGISPGDKDPDTPLQNRPGDHDRVLALKALNADIGPQADDNPFVSAARMGLFEPDDVSQPEFQDHAFSIPTIRIMNRGTDLAAGRGLSDRSSCLQIRPERVNLISEGLGGAPGRLREILAARGV
jgi:hypothetical protein